MTPERRFPIGPAPQVSHLLPEQRCSHLAELALLPSALTAIAAQVAWDTPYREGGWTRRQVIHHLADSHMNGYVRTKLILTEDVPVIQPYSPDAWVDVEGEHLSPEVSIALLTGLHVRWVALLETLPIASWSRTCVHPELLEPSTHPPAWSRNFVASSDGQLTLDSLLSTYAWHGKHHLAHLLLTEP